MNFNTTAAPYIRSEERTLRLSMDYLIVLGALVLFSAFRYGVRPILLTAVGMATAMGCEWVCGVLMKRHTTLGDGTAAVTGALIASTLSPSAPYWMPVVGAAFAILVIKMPMGGNGRYPFNPAAGGLAILTFCFNGFMFAYPDPDITVPLSLSGSLSDVVTEIGPAAQLMQGGQSTHSATMLWLGDYPGPIGATALLILIAGAIYLCLRRSASPLILVSYLLTCAVMAVAFPRAAGSVINSVLVELSAGYLLLGGLFLLNDFVTAPGYGPARVVYGVLAGVLVMLLRYFGRFEEGVCFAVLLLNAVAPLIDRGCWYICHYRWLKKEKQL